MNQTERNYHCRDSLLYVFIEKRTLRKNEKTMGTKYKPVQTKIENFMYQSRKRDLAGAAGETEISARETPHSSARGH